MAVCITSGANRRQICSYRFQRLLGNSFENKGIGRCHLPPQLPSINTETPAGNGLHRYLLIIWQWPMPTSYPDNSSTPSLLAPTQGTRQIFKASRAPTQCTFSPHAMYIHCTTPSCVTMATLLCRSQLPQHFT